MDPPFDLCLNLLKAKSLPRGSTRAVVDKNKVELRKPERGALHVQRGPPCSLDRYVDFLLAIISDETQVVTCTVSRGLS